MNRKVQKALGVPTEAGVGQDPCQPDKGHCGLAHETIGETFARLLTLPATCVWPSFPGEQS